MEARTILISSDVRSVLWNITEVRHVTLKGLLGVRPKNYAIECAFMVVDLSCENQLRKETAYS